MTRRVVANFAMTVDGRITGPGGNADMGWVVPHAFSDVVRDHLAAVHGAATTAVMGSVNAEGFYAVWPGVAGDPDADPRDRGFARWLTETDKLVFSSTGRSSWPDARVVSGDPVPVIDELRSGDGGDLLILASVSVIMPLLAADRVDRLTVVLCPEILGAGRQLFTTSLPASGWVTTSATSSDSGAQALILDRRAAA